MPKISDAAFDAALAYLRTNAARLDLCTQDPTSYTAATATYTVGNKTGVTLGATEDRPLGGRQAQVSAITDGAVTGNGTAAFWALTDNASLLLATGPLSASQAVTNGNSFQLPAFPIGIKDAVAE